MSIELDHLMLTVSDRAESIAFYTSVLGLTYDGDDGPFSTLRVTPAFVLLLAEGETSGGEHLAFALSEHEFGVAFQKLIDRKIPYGDRFDSVGSMRGPALETGARGIGHAVYFFDPDRHLLEIRYY
jgi:catechol 2,3-dioxygenase-like lactoylglutathione lyase family enzyme